MMSELRAIGLDLVPGAIYHFRGLEGPANGRRCWKFPPGDYQFLGVARDYRTGQDQVVYVGVNGRDRGIWHICCLSDWERDFRRVTEEQGK